MLLSIAVKKVSSGRFFHLNRLMLSPNAFYVSADTDSVRRGVRECDSGY